MEEDKLYSKKRDKKVFITDIAIEKVPLIQYRGLNDMENEVLYQLAKLVLLTSQAENDSNEVAITCTLDSDNPLEEIGISFGSEHEVDICADTASNHLLLSAQKCAVVVLHNHPSTQTLSIEDWRRKMSEYTLNDINFNPAPLTLCPIGQGGNTDQDALKQTFQKNRELIERLEQQFNKRKMSGERIG